MAINANEMDMLAQLLAGDAPPTRQGAPRRMTTEYSGSSRRISAPQRRTTARWEERYQRGSTAASVGVVAVLWGLLWLLNGVFTVRALASFGMLPIAAWGVQIGASLVEGKLWRTRLRVLYPVIALIGVLDVLASAWGILLWLVAYDLLPSGMAGSALATGLAMVIALTPEPMLVMLARWLGREVGVGR